MPTQALRFVRGCEAKFASCCSPFNTYPKCPNYSELGCSRSWLWQSRYSRALNFTNWSSIHKPEVPCRIEGSLLGVMGPDISPSWRASGGGILPFTEGKPFSFRSPNLDRGWTSQFHSFHPKKPKKKFSSIDGAVHEFEPILIFKEKDKSIQFFCPSS